MSPIKPKKAVYTRVKSAQSGNEISVRIGWAHTNDDDSIDVFLDALPINGKIHIRDWSPMDTLPDPR